MKEFMLLFRHVPQEGYQPSQKEIEDSIKKWQDWIGSIAAQGKFVDTKQLSMEGKTLKPDQVVTDGPYAEVKEILGGYLITKAADMEEALKIAEGCPILAFGGHVEVRSFIEIDM